jgi:DNA-directed RNA polymerase subunit RPC12/RpoP
VAHISNPEQLECPHCQGTNLHRVMVMQKPFPQEVRCRDCGKSEPRSDDNWSVVP